MTCQQSPIHQSFPLHRGEKPIPEGRFRPTYRSIEQQEQGLCPAQVRREPSLAERGSFHPLAISLARKTCAHHPSTWLSLSRRFSNHFISDFFGGVSSPRSSGTEGAGGATLSSSSQVGAPCPWGGTNEATRRPASRGQGRGQRGPHQQCCGCCLAWGWPFCPELLWSGGAVLPAGLYPLGVWSLPWSLGTVLALGIVPTEI